MLLLYVACFLFLFLFGGRASRKIAMHVWKLRLFDAHSGPLNGFTSKLLSPMLFVDDIPFHAVQLHVCVYTPDTPVFSFFLPLFGCAQLRSTLRGCSLDVGNLNYSPSSS